MVSIFLLGCRSQEFEDQKTLLEYLSNDANGYIDRKEVNGISYTLSYRPTDLQVQQEVNDITTLADIDSLRARYSKQLYLSLTLSKEGMELLGSMRGGRQQFAEMAHILSFRMGERLTLHTDTRDTLELLDYSAPRSYGMSPNTNILLVYPRDPEKLKGELLTLTIADLGLGTGEVNMRLSMKKLNQEPGLIFSDKTVTATSKLEIVPPKSITP